MDYLKINCLPKDLLKALPNGDHLLKIRVSFQNLLNHRPLKLYF
jgi:hypothetical protein